MKRSSLLLATIIFCMVTLSYSQDANQISMYNEAINKVDSTLITLKSFLNTFNPADSFGNFFCSKTSENIGDYYRLRFDYINAIKYYDSADTKYKDIHQNCAFGYNIDFVPKQYKIAYCYAGLNSYAKAIDILTPYIFDHYSSYFLDSTMTAFYVHILTLFYGKKVIEAQLHHAIIKIKEATEYQWTQVGSFKHLYATCKLTLFNTEVEIVGSEIQIDNDQIPFDFTREFFVQKFMSLKVFKQIKNNAFDL